MTKLTCAKIQYESWDTVAIPDSNSNRSRRTRASAPANNEIFTHMAKYLTDPFWIDRFKEATEGIFPSKISYSNGVLQYKGNDDISILLRTELDPESTPDINARWLQRQTFEVVDFYRGQIQMYSPMDLTRMSENRYRDISEIDDEEAGNIWSKMRPRQQEISLINFVKKEREKRNLSLAQTRQLEYLVNICKILKYTNNDTIHVRRFHIVSQTFLLYDDENEKFVINAELVKPIKIRQQKRKPPKEKLTFLEKWEEFQRIISDKSANIRNYKFPTSPSGETEVETTGTTDMDSVTESENIFQPNPDFRDTGIR